MTFGVETTLLEWKQPFWSGKRILSSDWSRLGEGDPEILPGILPEMLPGIFPDFFPEKITEMFPEC